jgi:hypothetical protein
MQDVGCRMQDAGCRIQDTGCGMQDVGGEKIKDKYRYKNRR